MHIEEKLSETINFLHDLEKFIDSYYIKGRLPYEAKVLCHLWFMSTKIFDLMVFIAESEKINKGFIASKWIKGIFETPFKLYEIPQHMIRLKNGDVLYKKDNNIKRYSQLQIETELKKQYNIDIKNLKKYHKQFTDLLNMYSIKYENVSAKKDYPEYSIYLLFFSEIDILFDIDYLKFISDTE